MEYLLMIFRSEAETHKASPEQTAQVTAAYGAYAEALVENVYIVPAKVHPVDRPGIFLVRAIA